MAASRRTRTFLRSPALLFAAGLLALAAVLAGTLAARTLLGGSSAPGEYRGTVLDGDPAPLFTLTDQRGEPVSLQDFRGKVVVLTFMDSECDDVCPLVGRALLSVARELGPSATRVAYLAVNTNARHASLADMAAFTRQYGLDSLPGWHFLTGGRSDLERVWNDYYIGVTAAPDGHVDHTAAVYVLDRDGKQRLLFTATMTDSNLAALREALLEQVRKLG